MKNLLCQSYVISPFNANKHFGVLLNGSTICICFTLAVIVLDFKGNVPKPKLKLVDVVVHSLVVILNFNPLTLMSDQDRISPFNINTISRRQVMRIKENLNERIIS